MSAAQDLNLPSTHSLSSHHVCGQANPIGRCIVRREGNTTLGRVPSTLEVIASRVGFEITFVWDMERYRYREGAGVRLKQWAGLRRDVLLKP
jgi:hypothetical protein